MVVTGRGSDHGGAYTDSKGSVPRVRARSPRDVTGGAVTGTCLSPGGGDRPRALRSVTAPPRFQRAPLPFWSARGSVVTPMVELFERLRTRAPRGGTPVGQRTAGRRSTKCSGEARWGARGAVEIASRRSGTRPCEVGRDRYRATRSSRDLSRRRGAGRIAASFLSAAPDAVLQPPVIHRATHLFTRSKGLNAAVGRMRFPGPVYQDRHRQYLWIVRNTRLPFRDRTVPPSTRASRHWR